MANITIWPSQPLDGDQWERNTWDIGTPITKEKLENLEEGIAVLATQMEALLREIEIDPSDIILNGTRLDTIQKWITAAEDGTYDFTKGSIATRLASIDTLNSTQNNRLDNIENVNSTQSTDINSLKTRATNLENRATAIEELNTTQNERLDKNDNKIAAIAKELGGGTPDGTSTTYPIISTRLDDLEKEIGGARSAGNGYTNSRIDDVQTWITGSNSGTYDGAAISTRLNNIDTLNTTQNNRLTALENELSGSGTGTSGSSRLDNLQTWIAGAPTSTYSGAAIATRLTNIDTLDSQQNSRLASLEASRTTDESRLDSLEESRTSDEANIATLQTDNTTNKTNIANIINEIGGTYTSSGFTNSQVSKIPSIIEKNDTQDSNIGKIKLEVWGPNKDFNDESRIDTLESGLSTINSTVLNHESRISRIETGAVAAKILNYTTTNTSASDSLILPANSLLDKNSIIMIFLNVATLGTNNLTIKDSTGTYNIKVNNQANSNLKTKFAAGSLLGLYRGNTTDIYMFNAPLAI